MCGHPLYIYHHLVPYELVKEHGVDNIALLCREHHGQLHDYGLLTDEDVAKANDAPVNRTNGVTAPYGLNLSGREFSLVVGGNTFIPTGPCPDGRRVMSVFAVDDVDLVGVELTSDGEVGIHLNIFNQYNLPILMVRNNELIVQTNNTWDIQFAKRTLTMRAGLGNILLELLVEPPDRLHISRARLLFNGVSFGVKKNELTGPLGGFDSEGCTYQASQVIRIGRTSRGGPAVYNQAEVDRYGAV